MIKRNVHFLIPVRFNWLNLCISQCVTLIDQNRLLLLGLEKKSDGWKIYGGNGSRLFNALDVQMAADQYGSSLSW